MKSPGFARVSVLLWLQKACRYKVCMFAFCIFVLLHCPILFYHYCNDNQLYLLDGYSNVYVACDLVHTDRSCMLFLKMCLSTDGARLCCIIRLTCKAGPKYSPFLWTLLMFMCCITVYCTCVDSLLPSRQLLFITF